MTSLLFYFLVPGGLQNLTRIQIGDCDTLHVRMVSFVHFSMRAETNPPGKKIKHPRAIIGGVLGRSRLLEVRIPWCPLQMDLLSSKETQRCAHFMHASILQTEIHP